MTIYIQKVKGQLHCDIVTFCKNTVRLVIIHNS